MASRTETVFVASWTGDDATLVTLGVFLSRNYAIEAALKNIDELVADTLSEKDRIDLAYLAAHALRTSGVWFDGRDEPMVTGSWEVQQAQLDRRLV